VRGAARNRGALRSAVSRRRHESGVRDHFPRWRPLELAPEAGLSVVAKISGNILTVPVRDKGQLRMVRCLELPARHAGGYRARVLVPTFVYMEDNLGGRPDKLFLCGFGAETQLTRPAISRTSWAWQWSLCGRPGLAREHNAGLLGYCGASPGTTERPMRFPSISPASRSAVTRPCWRRRLP